MKKTFFIIIIIVFILISSLWYVIKGSSLFNEIFGFLLYPFWKSASFLSEKSRIFLRNYLVLIEVKEENERLKKENLLLKSQLAYYKEKERIYKTIEDFYKVSSFLDYPKVLGRIIYKPMDPFSGIIFIDKGRNDGILPQMPVLASVDGEAVALIGQVVEVHKNWSKAIFITDPSFAADVKVERTGDRGILVGKAEKYCNLQYLPSTSELQPGDEILTSGQDAFFPPGLLVGIVITVNKDPVQGIFKFAEVKPVVDLHNIDLVLILLKLPEIPL